MGRFNSDIKIDKEYSNGSGEALTRYMAFIEADSSSSIAAAFGQNNEENTYDLGRALALYVYYKGVNREEYPFDELMLCNNIADINANQAAQKEICNCTTLYNFIASNDYSYTNIVYNLPDYVIFDPSQGINLLGEATITKSVPSTHPISTCTAIANDSEISLNMDGYTPSGTNDKVNAYILVTFPNKFNLTGYKNINFTGSIYLDDGTSGGSGTTNIYGGYNITFGQSISENFYEVGTQTKTINNPIITLYSAYTEAALSVKAIINYSKTFRSKSRITISKIVASC